MKKLFYLLLLSTMLAGCSTPNIFRNTNKLFSHDQEKPIKAIDRGAQNEHDKQNDKYHLASTHWSDVAKIRQKAIELSIEVNRDEITKVQAAQYLNRFRLQLVGHNMVDDDVYEVYLQSAVKSQQGEITTNESKAYIQNALKGWQQRWPHMMNKPANPAFTNFLMEIMKLTPLT